MDLGSTEAQKLLQEHLEDIQGKASVPWAFEFYNKLGDYIFNCLSIEKF